MELRRNPGSSAGTTSASPAARVRVLRRLPGHRLQRHRRHPPRRRRAQKAGRSRRRPHRRDLRMNGRLKALLVGGPMYDPLYRRLAEFEEIRGPSVETVVAPTHPDLNEQIEAEFASGGASYDLI